MIVLDVIVTSIREYQVLLILVTLTNPLPVLIYLSRAKANVYSSRFRRVMRKLVIMVWEAAVPPCVCAVLVVVTYLTLVRHFSIFLIAPETHGRSQVNKNYWDLMFQAILGKLYVISLFVTLYGFSFTPSNFIH